MTTLSTIAPKIKVREISFFSDDLLKKVALDDRVTIKSLGLFARVLANGRMTFPIDYVSKICRANTANIYPCIEELCLLGYLDNIVRVDTGGGAYVVLWVKRETQETWESDKDHVATKESRLK